MGGAAPLWAITRAMTERRSALTARGEASTDAPTVRPSRGVDHITSPALAPRPPCLHAYVLGRRLTQHLRTRPSSRCAWRHSHCVLVRRHGLFMRLRCAPRLCPTRVSVAPTVISGQPLSSPRHGTCAPAARSPLHCARLAAAQCCEPDRQHHRHRRRGRGRALDRRRLVCRRLGPLLAAATAAADRCEAAWKAARRRSRRRLRRRCAAPMFSRPTRPARASPASPAAPSRPLDCSRATASCPKKWRGPGGQFPRCAYICTHAMCVPDAFHSPLHEGMWCSV